MAVPYLIMLAEALVILFELRALMQTSSIDFYHPATQAYRTGIKDDAF